MSCVDWPAASVVAPADTSEMLTSEFKEVGCPNKTVAVATMLGSARLVAEMVTCASVPNEDGAVYRPFTIVPRFGLMDQDQCTIGLSIPLITAVNCALWPACRKTDAGVMATEGSPPGVHPHVGLVGGCVGAGVVGEGPLLGDGPLVGVGLVGFGLQGFQELGTPGVGAQGLGNDDVGVDEPEPAPGVGPCDGVGPLQGTEPVAESVVVDDADRNTITVD